MSYYCLYSHGVQCFSKQGDVMGCHFMIILGLYGTNCEWNLPIKFCMVWHHIKESTAAALV